MIARDARGWDLTDPDLWVVIGDEHVTLSTVATRDFPDIGNLRDEYYRLVQTEVPPVWVWNTGHLITGAHRLTAAHRLGMAEYPAYIVPPLADCIPKYGHVVAMRPSLN